MNTQTSRQGPPFHSFIHSHLINSQHVCYCIFMSNFLFASLLPFISLELTAIKAMHWGAATWKQLMHVVLEPRPSTAGLMLPFSAHHSLPRKNTLLVKNDTFDGCLNFIHSLMTFLSRINFINKMAILICSSLAKDDKKLNNNCRVLQNRTKISTISEIQ